TSAPPAERYPGTANAAGALAPTASAGSCGEGVELRGVEPLTPSMRTRCATGLRHSPFRRKEYLPGTPAPPPGRRRRGGRRPRSADGHAARLVLVDVGEADVVVVQTDHRAVLPA